MFKVNWFRYFGLILLLNVAATLVRQALGIDANWGWHLLMPVLSILLSVDNLTKEE